jgi:predicted DNA-binding protein
MPQPKSVDPTKEQAANKMINFRLTPSMYSFIQRKSKETGKSVSQLLRERIDFNSWAKE